VKTTTIILFMVLLLGTISCGSKQSATTLKVNSNFAATNSGFTGGLVVMGTHSSGESFSLPMDFTATGDNTIQMNLKRGSWVFSAIGWEGTLKFQGATKCELSNVTLNQDSQTIDLTLTTAKCSSYATALSANSFDGSTFKEIAFSTCGTFYMRDGTIPDSSMGPYFCTQGTNLVAPSYRKHAGSIRVEVISNASGVVGSAMNTCVPSISEGAIYSGLKIPPNLPLKVTLFDNVSCGMTDPRELMATYHFPAGLLASYSDQDHLLNYAGSSTNLFLPSNPIKRGKNSFRSLLPKITCSGTSCVSLPTTIPSAADRVILPNREFVFKENLDGTENCSNSAITGTASFVNFSYNPGNCQIRDGKVFGRINFDSLSALGTLTITGLSSTPIILNVVSKETVPLYDFVLETLGLPGTLPSNVGILNSFRAIFMTDEDHSSGSLSRVAELFGAESPLAALGSMTCEVGKNKTETLSFYDDGNYETYRVRLTDSAKPVPAYLCDATNPNALSCADTFNKRIVLQRLNPTSGVFETRESMHFNCLSKSGMYERQKVEALEVQKDLSFWNTSVEDQSRVESYTLDKEFLVSGDLLRSESSVERVERIANSSGSSDQAKVSLLSLNVFNNGSTYSSQGRISQLHVNNNYSLNVTNLIDVKPNANPYFIFTGPYDAQLAELSDRFFSAESKNERFAAKLIALDRCGETTPLRLIYASINDRLTGTMSNTSQVIPCTDQMRSGSISVNDNGFASFAYVIQSGPYYNPNALLFNGSAKTWHPQGTLNAQGIYTPISIKALAFPNNSASVLWIEPQSTGVYTDIKQARWTDFATAVTPTVKILGSSARGIFNQFSTVLSDDGNLRLFTTSRTDAGAPDRASYFSYTQNDTAVSSAENLSLGAYMSTLANSVSLSTNGNQTSVYVGYVSGATSYLQPFYFTENGTVNTTPVLGNAPIPVNPATFREICTSRTVPDFDSSIPNCNPIAGSYAKTIFPTIKTSIASLKPTVFEAVFTSEAVFKAQ
jgi:hypothetical protein